MRWSEWEATVVVSTDTSGIKRMCNSAMVMEWHGAQKYIHNADTLLKDSISPINVYN